ncbi:MAG: DKNYY domain-containing protein [Pirellulales bacterium]
MIKQSPSTIILAFTLGFLSTVRDVAAEDLGFGYVRRGEHIHFEGGGKTGVDSTRIDQPSRENIDGFSSALGRNLRACTSPDAASFTALSEEYSRDKNMVYYKWISPGRFLVVELPQADVTTFKAINFAHAIDKNTIWYLDLPIPHSDPATAELISDRIVKDSKRVYNSGEPQPHLDSETFRKVGSAYYTDVNGVYWGSEPIAKADPATFKVLGDSFIAVDATSVYRSGQPQPHLDAGTCKLILHDPYGYQVVSDKNGVYLNNLPFLHADPDHFEMVDKLTGKGGKYVFLVDLWHGTPVTVYREEDRLVAETILYAKGTTDAIATIKAEVAGDELTGVTLSAPPGKASASKVPEWQINIFKRADLVQRMKQAGELLK